MGVHSVLCFNSLTSSEPIDAIRLCSFYLACSIVLD